MQWVSERAVYLYKLIKVKDLVFPKVKTQLKAGQAG